MKLYLIVFTFVLILFDIINYYSIRRIIWSVVWCDHGGKYRKLKNISKNQPFYNVATMKYLKQYVSEDQKQFDFWINIKRIFVASEFLILIIWFALVLINGFLAKVILIAIFFQAFIIFLLLNIQEDAHRNTKYDNVRLMKKSKNHKNT